jgi:hypothetical protein
MFMFGEYGLESVEAIVRSIEPADELTATITAVDAAPAIHTSYTGTIPPFTSKMTFGTLAARKAPLPPIFASFVCDEHTAMRTASGDLVSQMIVNMAPPTSDEVPVDSFDVQYKLSSSATWISLPRLMLPGTSITIQGVVDGSRYDFRARSIGKYGIAGDTWTETSFVADGLLSAPDDVTGLTVVYSGTRARLVWNPISDIRPIEYEVRFGATPESAMVLGTTTSTIFDAIGNGDYWVAAKYLSAYSANWTSVDLSGAVLTDNVVLTQNEHTAWAGTLEGGAIKVGNVVQLDGAGNVLDMTNFLAEPDVLYYGGVASSGTYRHGTSRKIDIGRNVPSRLTMAYTVDAQNLDANFLAIPDFLAVGDVLDSGAAGYVSSVAKMRSSTDNVTWTAWMPFTPDTYVARYFEMGIDLATANSRVLPILSAMTASVDMPDDLQAGTNVSIASGAGSDITFGHAFAASCAPNVQVTIRNASAGDDAVVTSVTNTGFHLQVLNGGSGVARNIDYLAEGF